MTLAVLFCSCDKSKVDTLTEYGEDVFQSKPIVIANEINFYTCISHAGKIDSDSIEISRCYELLSNKVRSFLGDETKKKSSCKQGETSYDLIWDLSDYYVSITTEYKNTGEVSVDVSTGEICETEEHSCILNYSIVSKQ